MSALVSLDDVREDLSSILVDVLSSVLAQEAEPTADQLPPGPQAVARLAIHDHVIEEHTMVEIRLGVSLAKTISARMLSVAEPDPDDVVDAVAELGNIAGGQVKTLLCQHARLSLPSSQIVGLPPYWPLDSGAGGMRVRALMLGHVAQLAVVAGADPTGLLWPPDSDDDDDSGRLL